MLSGRRLDLLDPTAVDIEIEDIAHGLAFVARWNGQTRGDWPYSVAEHSLLVEEIYRRQGGDQPRWQIAGFSETEADKFFGRPTSDILRGLEIRLRPPAVVRTDYVARHKALLDLMT
jgi:hypothetical protein